MPVPSQRTSIWFKASSAAEQGPTQQHGGAERDFQQPEPRLHDRVVGGLLVRSERHRAGERRRHRVAMLRDVAYLSRRQPELHHQPRHEEGGEGEGQGGGLHPGILGHRRESAA
jgi:hypothetical protein